MQATSTNINLPEETTGNQTSANLVEDYEEQQSERWKFKGLISTGACKTENRLQSEVADTREQAYAGGKNAREDGNTKNSGFELKSLPPARS
jgi:hypothetical protein